MSSKGLFDEFSEVSAKQWKQKIQFDLKGADYNETLVWESGEDIHVKPFYNAEDVKENHSPKIDIDHGWKIGQTIYAGDTKKANTKALDVILRGAESLIFIIPDESADFGKLLNQIPLDTIPIHFHFEFLALEPIQRLMSAIGEQKATVRLHIDLVGHLAQSGNWYHNLEKDHALLEKLVQTVDSNTVSVLGANLSLYQNSGATMVQQLAYGLAHANEYLNHFASKEQALSKSFTFQVAVGSNYFFEIAKIRALRMLWASLAKAYDLQTDCHILAFPSKRNKTLYDYNVNMLRTTSECMSAILGGADTVMNLPYDALYHKDNEFGERISRNQLLLLKKESYLDQGAQAAEGAFYIESLTRQLAEKAWALFKQIESAGGFLSELKKGNIQRKIKESAAKELDDFDAGKITLLGTNKFQNPEDRMKDNLELYPFVKTNARKTLIEPIIERRLAEELEQKRLDDE